MDWWSEPSYWNRSWKDPTCINSSNKFIEQTTHPSTIVCPITTNGIKETEILRIHLKKGTADLQKDSDIVIDQIRTIDNKRLITKIGDLPKTMIDIVKENIKIMMDID